MAPFKEQRAVSKALFAPIGKAEPEATTDAPPEEPQPQPPASPLASALKHTVEQREKTGHRHASSSVKNLTGARLRHMVSDLAEQFYERAKSRDASDNAKRYASSGLGIMVDKYVALDTRLKSSREDASAGKEEHLDAMLRLAQRLIALR